MAEFEDDIVDAGAEIIWVLEQDENVEPGTAALCMPVMDEIGSEDQGWCVGDSEALPVAYPFDDSPFAENRGFDMIVARSTMEVVWVSTHGSGSANENLEGSDVYAAVLEALDKL